MRTFNDKEKVLDTKEYNGSKIEIISVPDLEGCSNSVEATKMFFIKQAGLSMKMIKITLNNSECMTESGALYFSKGKIENDVPTKGMIKNTFKSIATKETIFNPRYKGTGEIYLEPTFEHYLILTLDNDEIIVDKGLYFCSIGNIETFAYMQKNISSAVAGEEGLFQTRIKGSGIVVLAISVPIDEIKIYELNNDKLQVDGNFAIARTKNVEFTVEKFAKGLFGSFAGGEGFLQTFKGIGTVWMAPTAPVYRNLDYLGLSGVSTGKMNNQE